MSLNFENKLKMLKAVQYTLLTNSDITSTFASEVGKYEEYLHKIRELSQKINSNKNNTQSTDLEANIKQASTRFASAVSNYAVMAGRTDLMTNNYIKVKTIEKSTGEQLYQNCIQLLNIVKENQISLTLFGINDRKISDYENMLYFYAKLRDKSPDTFDNNVEGICEEAVRFLEETIDNLVENEKRNFPKFYNEYKFARSSSEEQVQNFHFFA